MTEGNKAEWNMVTNGIVEAGQLGLLSFRPFSGVYKQRCSILQCQLFFKKSKADCFTLKFELKLAFVGNWLSDREGEGVVKMTVCKGGWVGGVCQGAVTEAESSVDKHKTQSSLYRG